jgi:hypothetical protein
MQIIEFYNDNLNEGIELVDTLIRKKVLFKSNISKGLVMYLNKHENPESNKTYKETVANSFIYNTSSRYSHRRCRCRCRR